MSGFWAGAVPPWAYVTGAGLGLAFLFTGMWVGYGRGWDHAKEDDAWGREQAKARRTHPVYRPIEIEPRDPIDQATTVGCPYCFVGPGERCIPHAGVLVHRARVDAWKALTVLLPTAVYGPEDQSVTAWTARQAAKMDAFLRELFEVTDEKIQRLAPGPGEDRNDVMDERMREITR